MTSSRIGVCTLTEDIVRYDECSAEYSVQFKMGNKRRHEMNSQLLCINTIHERKDSRTVTLERTRML